MIRITNLSYSYSSATKLTFPEWEIANAAHGLMLGASGCGKTTLLHLMSGLLKPASGQVLYDDQDITKLSGSQLDAFRGANVGLVFQKPHLLDALSVKENIRLARYLGKKRADEARIEALLEALGLIDLADRKIFEISQGQAQRVSIARALVNGPKVIFGDEPTASLDDHSCERVITLLLEQAEQNNATLILATHDQRVKSHFSNTLAL